MTALPKSTPVGDFSGKPPRMSRSTNEAPNLNDSERAGGPPGARGPARNLGKGAVAAIHTLKSKLRLSDDDYRALLIQLTGHTSSKDCSPAQQKQVRDHLQLLTERMGVASPKRHGDFAARVKAASPRERKIWAIWLSMARSGLVHNKSSQALDAFVYRQTGVAALTWCTSVQLDAVIEALKLWQKRGAEVRK